MNIDHVVGNPSFVNTRYFREAALHFKKHGRYTLAPMFSKEWYEFWEEQERRCLQGYKVGGVKITGRHYWYMNFTQLRKTSEDDKGKIVATKDYDFPAFWLIDYDWFWYKEIAWQGCSKDIINKLHLFKNPAPNIDGTYGGAMHLGCAKTRRGGFSYKEGADGSYNYHLFPGSKSLYFAAKEDYLIEDGILNKVEYGLNFLNEHTDTWWLKHRMKHSTTMHQMASYKPKHGQGNKGTLSEIMGVVINDPDKARGKDAIKIAVEEGGSFPILKKAVRVALPSLYDGDIMTGQMSIFGTGGNENDTGLEGLEDIFNEPRLWKILPFENNWEEGYEGTECGVFVPYYMCNTSFMDLDGNIDFKGAIAFQEKERAILRTAKDHKVYDQHIAEKPGVPSEAFSRISNSIFPRGEILLQKNRILKSRELQAKLSYGDLVQSVNGLEFIIKSKVDAKPVDKYPHKNDDKLDSCVTVFEPPQKLILNSNNVRINKVPDDVYLIVVDPYYKDDAESRISLGAAYVVKQRSRYFNNPTDIDVAWYVGRPNKTDDFYLIVLKLADWYNAKIQSEIAGGGKGLLDYARVRRKLDRLCFEPVNIEGKEIEKISKNRNYFMDLPTEMKKLGLIYYADWLKTVVGLDSEGGEIWNLHYEYDIGILDELLKFNDKGNFDRLSAKLIKMFMIKERAIVNLNRKEKNENKNSVLSGRPLFSDGVAKNQTYGGSLITLPNELI